MIDKLKLFTALLIVAAGIYGFYFLAEQHALIRAGTVLISVIAAAGVALTSAQGQAAWEFTKGARLEVRKVVWPTRRETMQATMVVIGLVVIVGVFLWVADALLFYVVYDLVLDTAKK